MRGRERPAAGDLRSAQESVALAAGFAVPRPLLIAAVACRTAIDADATSEALVATNFAALRVDREPGAVHHAYVVRRRPEDYVLARAGEALQPVGDAADLLYALEHALTLDLQRRRPDLLFLHAAALVRRGRAYLFAAASGAGKSTLAWSLLHRGWSYLSDELAPVDPASLCVWPYPHALCLKAPPPGDDLPSATLRLGRTMHVPVDALPAAHERARVRLGGVFLLQRAPTGEPPRVRALGASEAAARLYVHALNALAHPCAGLDATLRIAASVPCHLLSAAAPAATCDLIDATLASFATC